jgi:Zn-dependent M16 (insulinase) family peptidase
LQVTYDQVLNYRETFYKPSNSVMICYGHLNQEFLNNLLQKLSQDVLNHIDDSTIPSIERTEKTKRVHLFVPKDEGIVFHLFN